MRNVKDIVLTFLHNLALSLSYCIEVRNFDQRRENLALSMMKSPNQIEVCKHEYKTTMVENIQADDDDVLQHEFQGC